MGSSFTGSFTPQLSSLELPIESVNQDYLKTSTEFIETFSGVI